MDTHNLSSAIAVMTAWEASEDPDASMKLAHDIIAEMPEGEAQLVDSLISLCAVLLKMREQEAGSSAVSTLRALGRLAQTPES